MSLVQIDFPLLRLISLKVNTDSTFLLSAKAAPEEVNEDASQALKATERPAIKATVMGQNHARPLALKVVNTELNRIYNNFVPSATACSDLC